MNPEHDEDVRALFDSTAAEASGPVLTKLKARARDIPLTARRSWWARFAAPTFALVTGAAAAAFLLRATPEVAAPMGTSATVVAATTQAPVAANPATAEPAPAVQDPDVLDDESEEEMAGLEAVAWGDSDDLWSGASIEAEADSEDLLAALDSWMEEDG